MVQPARGAADAPTSSPILVGYERDGTLLGLRSGAGEEVPLDVHLSLGGTESCGGIRLVPPKSPLAPDTTWTLAQGRPSSEPVTTGRGPAALPDVVRATVVRYDVQLTFVTGSPCAEETHGRIAVLGVTPGATGSLALLDVIVAYGAKSSVHSRIIEPGTVERQGRSLSRCSIACAG